MDNNEFETLLPQLGEEVKSATKQTGNSFQEATKVMKVLYPNGISGREQDAFATVRILDKLFRVANAPVESSSQYWKELAAYVLSAVKTSG